MWLDVCTESKRRARKCNEAAEGSTTGLVVIGRFQVEFLGTRRQHRCYRAFTLPPALLLTKTKRVLRLFSHPSLLYRVSAGPEWTFSLMRFHFHYHIRSEVLSPISAGARPSASLFPRTSAAHSSLLDTSTPPSLVLHNK